MALFGRKTEKKAPVDNAGVYVLMDSNSRMLARGRLMDAPGRRNLYIKLTDGDVKTVADAGIVQAVPQDKSLPPQMTRVADFRPGAVALEPMRELGTEVRRNFRVPVAFDSFVYPESGGRAAMTSVDLSCGGIAFRSPQMFAVGDVFEIVVPMTSDGPLLLRAEVLRVHLEQEAGNFYACKFVNMIDDEESYLREAVFAIQISSVKTRKS
ncbi:MAG: PilZ domain-containing protein [Oscillospiraceae bacterium]|nr:PilZ domain-containing protein [Oscillospiraceae bacterium]